MSASTSSPLHLAEWRPTDAGGWLLVTLGGAVAGEVAMERRLPAGSIIYVARVEGLDGETTWRTLDDAKADVERRAEEHLSERRHLGPRDLAETALRCTDELIRLASDVEALPAVADQAERARDVAERAASLAKALAGYVE